MSIATEILRLQNVKADIAAAIEQKGVTVPAGAMLADMPELILAISGGSGGGGIENPEIINTGFSLNYWSSSATTTDKWMHTVPVDNDNAYFGRNSSKVFLNAALCFKTPAFNGVAKRFRAKIKATGSWGFTSGMESMWQLSRHDWSTEEAWAAGSKGYYSKQLTNIAPDDPRAVANGMWVVNSQYTEFGFDAEMEPETEYVLYLWAAGTYSGKFFSIVKPSSEQPLVTLYGDPSYAFYYNEGDICQEASGGWSRASHTDIEWPLEFGADSFYFATGSANDRYYVSTEKSVNLTNISTLFLDAISTTDLAYLTVGTSRGTYISGRYVNAQNGSRGIVALDVSDLTGEHYIQVVINKNSSAAHNMRVYRIWRE